MQSVTSGCINNIQYKSVYLLYLLLAHLLLSSLKVDETLHHVIDVCKQDMSYVFYIAV